MCQEVCDEYITIISSVEDEHVRIYTYAEGDGTHLIANQLPWNQNSQTYTRNRNVLIRLSDGLESATISEAVLMAVYKSL